MSDMLNLDRVCGIGLAEYIKRIGQMLATVEENLVPFSDDAISEKVLRLDTDRKIITTIALPPPIQALRLEYLMLDELADRFEEKTPEYEELSAKANFVYSIIIGYIYEEMKRVAQVRQRIDNFEDVEFCFGSNWKVLAVAI